MQRKKNYLKSLEKKLKEEWNFKEKLRNSNIKYWDSYMESYKENTNYSGRITNITALIKRNRKQFLNN